MNFGTSQALRSSNRGFSAAIVLVLLLFLLASAGIGWVYNGMTTQERWPILWLEIDGPFERVSAEQLRARLAPLAGGSFFTVDVSKLRAAVADMAWVADVTINKRWPDTIHVSVREYTPLAHWIDGSLVAANSHAFRVPAADDIQGFPWLEGPPKQLAVVYENWQKIDRKLVTIGQQTQRLSLDPRGSWSVLLTGGTEVRLGKGDISEKLDTLIETWAGLMQGKQLPPVAVDLRYTNGFAVSWPSQSDKIVGIYVEKN